MLVVTNIFYFCSQIKDEFALCVKPHFGRNWDSTWDLCHYASYRKTYRWIRERQRRLQSGCQIPFWNWRKRQRLQPNRGFAWFIYLCWRHRVARWCKTASLDVRIPLLGVFRHLFLHTTSDFIHHVHRGSEVIRFLLTRDFKMREDEGFLFVFFQVGVFLTKGFP